VSLDRFSERFSLSVSKNLKKKIELFEKAGLLKVSGDTISLTKKGFLVSNSIISELITAWGL
jgi:coproporphyrinogen III oxidase-like Fe-S oxidoreductase